MMVDTYQNLVFSVCYKVTRDYFAAEDLAQETFLSAYKNLDGFEGGNEKAWLCRIATNKGIDYLRGSGRRAVPRLRTLTSRALRPAASAVRGRAIWALKKPVLNFSDGIYVKQIFPPMVSRVISRYLLLLSNPP